MISRHTMDQALDWQREKDAELRAHIAITRTLLDSYVAERAEYQALKGGELVYRFMAESPKAVQELMAGKQEFHERLDEIGVAWIWQRTEAAGA